MHFAPHVRLSFPIVCVPRVIEEIFSSIDAHIEHGNLITELNMSALPSLYAESVQLIKHLVIHFKRKFAYFYLMRITSFNHVGLTATVRKQRRRQG